MRTIEEILNNKKLHILTNDRLEDQIKITAYFFNPLDQKRWYVIFTRGLGWEHLSISQDRRTPDWDVMCMVKDIFWKDDEVCVQYHPRKEDYVTMHEHCLHIWKPIDAELPTPPTIMVGFVGVTPEETDFISKMYIKSLSKEEILALGKKRGIVANRNIRRGGKP